MPVRLRLQRRGRKKQPHYNIVVADNQKPRDGRSIQKLGYYNPSTTPATIKLDNEKALKWLHEGAQPTPTVDRILSFTGVKYRKHLLRGVKKGVLSQEEADEKYAKWLEDKSNQIQNRIDKAKEQANKQLQERLEAEAAINQKRAEALQAKRSEEGEGEETEEGSSEETEASTEEAATEEAKTAEESTPAEDASQEEGAEEASAPQEEAATETEEDSSGEEEAASEQEEAEGDSSDDGESAEGGEEQSEEGEEDKKEQ